MFDDFGQISLYCSCRWRQQQRQQQQAKLSLHSACFPAVLPHRSATISAVNSTCSCQGVEGCGDDTPQASSIHKYIYTYRQTYIHTCVRSQVSRPPHPPTQWYGLDPSGGDSLLKSMISVRIPCSRAILLPSSSEERALRSS